MQGFESLTLRHGLVAKWPRQRTATPPSSVQIRSRPPMKGSIEQLAGSPDCKSGFIELVGSNPTRPTIRYVPIAQLDRASDYGSEGWEFESSWARHRGMG